MKTIHWIALIPALAFGCNSTPFSNHYDGSTAVVVDDDIFVDVPEADREGIAQARTERSEMIDRVAISERDVSLGTRELDVAKEELGTAEAAVRTAEKSLAVARDQDESVRASAMKSANQRLEGARSRWHYAYSNVAQNRAHVSLLESQVDLAKMRLDWAESRVELAKAKAVHELGRPEADDISVSEFEARVAETQIQVAMAEIDSEAWARKVQLRQDSMDLYLASQPDTLDQQN